MCTYIWVIASLPTTQRGVARSPVPCTSPPPNAFLLSCFLTHRLKQPLYRHQVPTSSLSGQGPPLRGGGGEALPMPAVSKPFQPLPRSRPDTLAGGSVPVSFAFPALRLGPPSPFLLTERDGGRWAPWPKWLLVHVSAPYVYMPYVNMPYICANQPNYFVLSKLARR